MKFKVAAIFSDNMVLQRDKRICVFGEAEDDIQVTMSFLDQKVSAVSRDGRFKLWLEPLPATVLEGEDPLHCGSDMIITARKTGSGSNTEPDYEQNVSPGGVSDDQSTASESGQSAIDSGSDDICTVFRNVVVGEVWLAGGQSNMEYELQNMTGAGEIFGQGSDDITKNRNNVRFYYTQKKGFIDEEFIISESKTRWELFTDDGVKYWSAVGFLYAARLASRLGVIVGIVGCNWGGTSASAWIDRESLVSNDETRIYVDEYDEKVAGRTPEEQKADYDGYVERITKWDAEAQKIWAEKPDTDWDEMIARLGPNEWPGPMNMYNPFRPAGLYECMISRIMPYTLKGVIYYQGESDDHRPGCYYTLFSMLIRMWRRYFEDEELPFIHVQLPMHRYAADPDMKNWCVIRDAQMKVFLNGLSDGIAVIPDCGEFNEIHPKDKRVVADRLSKQALFNIYGLLPEEEAFGPILRDIILPGGAENYSSGASGDVTAVSGDATACTGKLMIVFDYAEKGFVIKNYNHSDLAKAHETDIINNDGIIGFEIAGADKEFYPAYVEIPGLNEGCKAGPGAICEETGSMQEHDKAVCLKKNVIILSSDKVSEPCYARYLWTNYGTVSLYGADSDIPMAPFDSSL